MSQKISFSTESQTKPYDTSYNRLKYVLALIILRNKPVDWKVEEYIRFINYNDVQQKKLAEITQEVKERIVDNNNNRGNQINKVNDKNIIVDKDNISQVRWRKRALELANDVESLKQQLCMVELELEYAKQTNKRRKTKAQQAISVSETISGTTEDDVAPTTHIKKQLEKRTSTKRSSRKYQDPDCQVFQEIPGADDGNVVLTTNKANNDNIRNVYKLWSYDNTNYYKDNKLYEYKVDEFARIFLKSPLLSNFEKNEIISTIATSFASLIKAIHVLTIMRIEELMQENGEIEISSEIQDPRDVIINVLIHICNEFEPKLKEAVCFMASKECLRLMLKELNISKDSATEDKNFSPTLRGEKSSEVVNSIVCKDTTYYLLRILEEISVNNQGCKMDNEILSEKAVKNITTLLKASILNNKQTSAHGDAFIIYLYNICEKLWVQLGSISFVDLLEK
ncbi:hypothetical protein C1645_830059 [Glomus cerebriforme]|uniref:Uncharacterized protein n=1 Tax=Glomus cerebriforme TaxID=658196 RepID=A0A397SPS9_9GLOM|nr:hypothetical protein C1645_830059 [Glomus cerebriforme]